MQAQAQFQAEATYLNTATVGLACDAAINALQDDLAKWRSGNVDAFHYDNLIAECRVSYGSLINAQLDRVAILSQVSVGTGVAATLLQSGDEVLLAEEDFTSVLFPLLQTADRGVRVRTAPLNRIIDQIGPSTTMVAVSSVQSADGRVIDLDRLASTAKSNNTLTLVDLTQSASWLACNADDFSITVCGAYKWLCSPRGSGFMTVQPEVADQMTAISSGWYAGEKPWESIASAGQERPPFRPVPGLVSLGGGRARPRFALRAWADSDWQAQRWFGQPLPSRIWPRTIQLGHRGH